MFRKTVCGVMLSLLLISMLALAFNVQSAKAEPRTITVPHDYPTIQAAINAANPGDTIYVYNGTYCESLVLDKTVSLIGQDPNITIIDGGGAKGVVYVTASNVILSGFTIRNGWVYGIYLYMSGGNTIQGNNITRNGFLGIFLEYSDNNIIQGNNITYHTGGGVGGYYSDYNIIAHNTISNNYIGIELSDYSYGNIVVNNTISNNSMFGIRLPDANGNTVTGNTITNNRDGVFVWADSNSIENNKITDNKGYGIYVTVSLENKITGNTIANNGEHGIYLWESYGNDIVYNLITNNTGFAIGLSDSMGNNIAHNTVISHWDGVWLYNSSGNIIRNNNITNSNRAGIILQNCSESNTVFGNTITKTKGVEVGGDGIWLLDSNNNNVTGNWITNNNRSGIILRDSERNYIIDNTIADNRNGIRLIYSNGNFIYHNDIVRNQIQVLSNASTNTWDDGYPSGGNYWSDYTGVDEFRGPYQNEPGSDGIGDTPYVIDEYNLDRYPLMNPYGAPTYTLTITTTIGGTTSPAPGTYTYTVNSIVQVTAFPDTGYLFDHWELNDTKVGSANPYTVIMNNNYILKAFFTLAPPPLTVSISPLSASILVGQSITFTSTVTGGYTPYSYQWYLNGNPVSGATSPSWTFTPTTSGIYYVNLKVTDGKGNIAQSEAARIAVASVPVGGYSIPIQIHIKTELITLYIALLTILTTTYTTIKRKTKRKQY